MNNWKKAFWIQTILCFGIILYLGYNVLDQSFSLTYMKEGYEDTEHDLMQVCNSVKGKLSRKDFKDIIDRYPDYHGEDLELSRIKISFDKNGIVDSITTDW